MINYFVIFAMLIHSVQILKLAKKNSKRELVKKQAT